MTHLHASGVYDWLAVSGAFTCAHGPGLAVPWLGELLLLCSPEFGCTISMPCSVVCECECDDGVYVEQQDAEAGGGLDGEGVDEEVDCPGAEVAEEEEEERVLGDAAGDRRGEESSGWRAGAHRLQLVAAGEAELHRPEAADDEEVEPHLPAHVGSVHLPAPDTADAAHPVDGREEGGVSGAVQLVAIRLLSPLSVCGCLRPTSLLDTGCTS